jgi:hypothetical protein
LAREAAIRTREGPFFVPFRSAALALPHHMDEIYRQRIHLARIVFAWTLWLSRKKKRLTL